MCSSPWKEFFNSSLRNSISYAYRNIYYNCLYSSREIPAREYKAKPCGLRNWS